MNDHKERAAFTISKALKAELEDVVPASKRSRFVEQAIADALLRDARKRALDALDKLPSYERRAKTASRFCAGSGRNGMSFLQRGIKTEPDDRH